MPGALLGPLYTLSHLILQQPCKGGPVISSLLTGRLGTDRITAQGPTASIDRARTEVCLTSEAALYFVMFFMGFVYLFALHTFMYETNSGTTA